MSSKIDYNAMFLLQLRKKLNLNQQEFAEILFISRQTLATLEKDCGHMSIKTYFRLLNFFNLRINDIIRQIPDLEDKEILIEISKIKSELEEIKNVLAQSLNA